MSTTFLIMLGMHALGDYYLQSDQLAKNKQHHYAAVAIHSLLYAFSFVPLLIGAHWSAFAVLVVSHTLLDSLKFLMQKGSIRASTLFIIDQISHLLILYVVSLSSPFLFFLPSGWEQVLRVVILLAWVTKPVSVMFTELFGRFRPLPGEGTEGAGKVIGYLERLILVILLIIGEYSVIGWIIAAKTFARSKQLSESQAFCEYFLVGTLMSILSTIVLYLAWFRW